ncbi:hypothetical protein [Metapseudomonas otitidis]|uniref:hypothetical protein n=1 Tax=Metapseudomonas otitidis TaxID=319939 RepID=UPI001AAFBDF5|nr:hypothetical protein [Pseudomonas otitidis]MBO2930907.1 hypothetical protein [Pseudomonas otitidis]
MKYSSLIPEEIHNAIDANRELGDVSLKAENHRAFLVINTLVLALGYTAGYFSHKAIDADVISAMIAFCGVIIGFVITSMLFSGRSEYAERLSLEQVKKYCLKTKYMLLSQSNTLFSYIFCSAFLIASMILLKMGALESFRYFISLSMAFLFLGGYRTLILPYQIYEVHSFALESISSGVRQQTSSEAKDKASARVFGYKSGISMSDTKDD